MNTISENQWKGTMMDKVPEVKRYKCGDEHPTGFIFWSYNKNCRGGMRLVTPDKYADLKGRGQEAINKKDRERRASDPLYRLKSRVRARMSEAFRNNGYSKTTKTHDMLGCSYTDLKTHLQNQFTEGMSWDNMGDWHIDHIIPLAAGKTQEDVIKLCHHTNLQPLWANQNMSKGDSYIADELEQFLTQ